MGFCDIPIAGDVCKAGDVASFASDPGKAISNWLVKSAGDLAVSSADLAARATDATTSVDLDAAWFVHNYETLLPIGLVLLVATFCAQLTRAAWRRDGKALAQAVTGTMSGVLFAFGAIAATTVALQVVDALSDGLFSTAGTTMPAAVRRTLQVSAIAGMNELGWAIPVAAALAAAIGAIMFWAVMLVRKVGILIMITLAPFAAAGGGWEVARRWRRGWIEATATLVVSKLLMTIIFILGLAAMTSSGSTTSQTGTLATVLSGVVILMLVLFCPYATFKFVHWAAETDSESLHRAGSAGAQAVRRQAENAARKAASASTGAPAGGIAPQGPDLVASSQFPGDIAPTGQDSTPPGPDDPPDDPPPGGGSTTTTTRLEKTVPPPPPTGFDDESSGQTSSPAGENDPGAEGPVPDTGGSSGWRPTPPAASPPPARGNRAATGPASTPPSPAGP